MPFDKIEHHVDEAGSGEAAAAHIAVFVEWAARHELLAEHHGKDEVAADPVRFVVERVPVFTEVDLTELGAAFAREHYDEFLEVLDEHASDAGMSSYEFAASSEGRECLNECLDEALAEFVDEHQRSRGRVGRTWLLFDGEVVAEMKDLVNHQGTWMGTYTLVEPRGELCRRARRFVELSIAWNGEAQEGLDPDPTRFDPYRDVLGGWVVEMDDGGVLEIADAPSFDRCEASFRLAPMERPMSR